MKRILRRVATIMIGLLFVCLFVTKCVPEKKVDLETKITPIRWIDEDRLIVRIVNDHFLRTPDGALQAVGFDMVYPGQIAPLGFQTAVPGILSEEVFSNETHVRTDNYVIVEGEKMRVRKPWYRWRMNGAKQGFPRGEYLDVYTFLHLGRVGFVTTQNSRVQKTELPLKETANTSPPRLKLDEITGNVFAFQTSCKQGGAKDTCVRTAWWLSPDLEVVSSFLMPAYDPLTAVGSNTCFSCGCGCYTQEDVYAVNGMAYFQYSGYPLKTSERGLYKVVEFDDGTSQWDHVIEGRIEPPLAFSPSGCRVAYFKVSRFGDRLETRSLC